MRSFAPKIGSLCAAVAALVACAPTVEATYGLLDPAADACWRSVTEERPAEYWEEWAQGAGDDLVQILPTVDGTCVLLPYTVGMDVHPTRDPWFGSCADAPECCESWVESAPSCPIGATWGATASVATGDRVAS